MARMIVMVSRMIGIAFWRYSSFIYVPSLKRGWNTARRASEPPSNPLKIKMLRGEFESYLPSSQAARLYELGKELGASEDPQQRAALGAALAETVDAVSMGIDAGSSFVESAMRDVSVSQPESEESQELVPADSATA